MAPDDFKNLGLIFEKDQQAKQDAGSSADNNANKS